MEIYIFKWGKFNTKNIVTMVRYWTDIMISHIVWFNQSPQFVRMLVFQWLHIRYNCGRRGMAYRWKPFVWQGILRHHSVLAWYLCNLLSSPLSCILLAQRVDGRNILSLVLHPRGTISTHTIRIFIHIYIYRYFVNH